MEENNNNNPNNQINDTSFKSVVSNTTYSSFEDKSDKKRKSSSTGFAKTVLLPFACGILGAGLVVGTCCGVPSIRNELLANSSVTEGSSSNTATLNTEQISLLDYSDTAVGVAQKVLPSIVGINVTYTVNSIFYSGGTATAQGSGVIISEDG